MNHSLETFIQQHRHAFDTAVPGAHGWNSLQRMLNRLPDADAVERHILYDRILLDEAEPSANIWKGICAQLDGCTPGSTPDPLEAFIRDNRAGFDTAAPRDIVWEQIARQTPAKAIKTQITPAFSWTRRLARVAAALALVLTGAGAGFWYAGGGVQPKTMELAEVSPEYAEVEQHFKNEITQQEAALTHFSGSRPAEVYTDLEQLDATMAELQQELATVPPGNREAVVRAMIETYEAKTNILKRVLERLQQMDSENTNSSKDEPNNVIKGI